MKKVEVIGLVGLLIVLVVALCSNINFDVVYLTEAPTIQEVQARIEARDLKAYEEEKRYLKKYCNGLIAEDFSCVSYDYYDIDLTK